MLPALEAPELFFGLCSPVGTDNKRVSEIISEALMKFSYETRGFKVTDLMKQISIPNMRLTEKPVNARYDAYIKYANEVRRLTAQPSALAMMCCGAVRAERRHDAQKRYRERVAYIFDQFKRKEEIEALRQVYGRLFVAVSIYSDKETRTQRLAAQIARESRQTRVSLEHQNSARELVQRDEDEEGVPSGQRLRDAFPLADLFINIDDHEGARRNVERFLNLLFGANDLSPTRDEYGMYIAKSAALRSLDLSRQVGAAIFSPEGEVVSLGSNEVPKAGGGTYWSGDKGDARDYVSQRDENEHIKKSIMADVIRRLSSENLFSTNRDVEEIVEEAISRAEEKGSLLRDALVLDLIEFGRIIHAEMSAISDAARNGRAVKGSVLYCTTFPCHICAKHIVSAGIAAVQFIEPYPKSYAEQLHKDSISMTFAERYSGPDRRRNRKVHFQPFIGISPYRFRELFERNKRKDEDGNFVKWRDGRPMPIVKYTIANWIENELALALILKNRIDTLVSDGVLSIRSG